MEAVWIFLTLEALTFEGLEPLTARAFSFAAGAAFEPVVCSSLLRLDRIERTLAQAKASSSPFPLSSEGSGLVWLAISRTLLSPSSDDIDRRRG